MKRTYQAGKRFSSLLAASLCCLACTRVNAQTPVWGEGPQTFGFGVFVPSVQLDYEDRSRFFRGHSTIPNPNDLRVREARATLKLDYGWRPTVNFGIAIPFASVEADQQQAGHIRRSTVSGIGDVVVTVKDRFLTQVTASHKIQHAIILGLRFPTGTHVGPDKSVEYLPISEQPGTGNWGVQVGYAMDRERLHDTVFFSTLLDRDLNGSNGRGFLWTADPAYGYWLRHGRRLEDVSFMLAGGLHLEFAGQDRINGLTDPNTGYARVGLQTSVIATRGPVEGQAGLVVPVYQYYDAATYYNAGQLAPPIQWRAGARIVF